MIKLYLSVENTKDCVIHATETLPKFEFLQQEHFIRFIIKTTVSIKNDYEINSYELHFKIQQELNKLPVNLNTTNSVALGKSVLNAVMVLCGERYITIEINDEFNNKYTLVYNPEEQ